MRVRATLPPRSPISPAAGSSVRRTPRPTAECRRGKHPNALAAVPAAGAVPQPGWIEAADRFMHATDQLDGAARAAVFRPAGATDYLRPSLAEIGALLRAALGGGPGPEQGLLIAASLLRCRGRPFRRRRCGNCVAASARAPAHGHAVGSGRHHALEHDRFKSKRLPHARPAPSPHPNSGLPRVYPSSALKPRSKSETSDFDWER